MRRRQGGAAKRREVPPIPDRDERDDHAFSKRWGETESKKASQQITGQTRHAKADVAMKIASVDAFTRTQS